ncbi:MAG TPA: hypothetical protein VHX86_16990 [Tepidisphaeraceae bacterium]|jgi:hypothetical protein|nr:hypothetical protein [Tepidisphaeraceae bacterium]
MRHTKTVCGGLLAMAISLTAGCTGDGRPTILPNSDPALRKTSAELAADSAKRAYEYNAPKAQQQIARAQYNVMDRWFDVANLSDADWKNVEVWVNQKYVVNVPDFTKYSGERLNFELFYDQDGHHFETDRGANPVQTLQIYHDGKMYDVVATLE